MNLLKYFFAFLFFTCQLSCDTKKKSDPTIRIATAANMQFAMHELSKKFTQNTHISCEMIVGSSGKLTAQIAEGAPYDLFVAANVKYPQKIFDLGVCRNNPRIYGYGRLVLWTSGNIAPKLEVLQTDSIKHIALPNPKVAPYGKAAYDLLTALPYFQKIEKKLVYGESISQTNQFISTQAAEIGFTALSVVHSEPFKNSGKWTALATEKQSLIPQAALLLTQKESAEKFFQFLFSPDAKKTLKKFGYLTDELNF